MIPKVSIITPVYNMEKYLNACINSLINQTYQNIEILLINDGSTDNSENICIKYASSDKRIKYFYQENGGVSKARNFGISNFSGDFVMFLDSDDFLDLSTIKTLVQIALTNNLDVLEFKLYIESNRNYGLAENQLIFEEKNQSALRIIKNRTFYVTNKLIHKSVFNNIFFIENQIYEDVLFPFKIYNNANAIGYLNTCFYHVVEENTNSLSRSNYSLKQLDQIKSYEQTIDFIQNNNFYQEAIQGLNNRLAFFYLNNFLNLTEFEKYDKNYALRKDIKQKLQNLNHSNSNFNIKILGLLPLGLAVYYFKIRKFIK
jgi:glycosyltransferase involved in cell wall biosynthesis